MTELANVTGYTVSMLPFNKIKSHFVVLKEGEIIVIVDHDKENDS